MVTWWLARALLSVAARRWPVEIRDEMDSESVSEEREEEMAAVAAVASAHAHTSPTPEEAKNDLDLPAFMRRDRRLFQ